MKKLPIFAVTLLLCAGILTACKGTDSVAGEVEIAYAATDHPMLQVADGLGPVLTTDGRIVIPCENFSVLMRLNPDDLRSVLSRGNGTGTINMSGTLSAVTLQPDRIYASFEDFVSQQRGDLEDEEQYTDVVQDSNAVPSFTFEDEGNTVAAYTRISYKQHGIAGGYESEMCSVFAAVENEGRLVYIHYICPAEQEPSMLAVYNTIVFTASSLGIDSPSTEIPAAVPDSAGEGTGTEDIAGDTANEA